MTDWALNRLIPAAQDAAEVIGDTELAVATSAGQPRDVEAGSTHAERFQEDLGILHDALRRAAGQVVDGHSDRAWTDEEAREYAEVAIDTGKRLLWGLVGYYTQAVRNHVARQAATFIQGGSLVGHH